MDTAIAIDVSSGEQALAKALEALEAARADVTRLEKLKSQEESRRTRLEDQLRELKAGRGERVLAALEGGDGQKAIKAESAKVAPLRAELDVLLDLLPEINTRIEAAKDHVAACKADALRAAAAGLRAEADQRQAKTDELKQALEAHEECAYEPKAPPEMPMPVDVKGSQLGGAKVIISNVPKTELLRKRAVLFEVQAEHVLRGDQTWPASILTGQKIDMPLWYPD